MQLKATHPLGKQWIYGISSWKCACLVFLSIVGSIVILIQQNTIVMKLETVACDAATVL